ncbi:hypothetical protein SAY86_004063 [Trapa natans]|uniref:Uncharacterized protein n=1 Tax=Trapa natans TaxID=22666 RepID=A0AAN7N2Z8_TRANT|nr:hypothetical protein SAY86_004063 [Trapa natans]
MGRRISFIKQDEDRRDLAAGVKRGPWSPDEDQKLVAYIRRYGIWNWTHMPKAAGLLRSGKSCRLRWMNYLRPNIKHGNFSREEEETIIKWHQLLGNRWSAIARFLPSRTDNEIKNYWNTRLKRHMRSEQSVHKPAKDTGDGASASSSTPAWLDNPNILESLPQEEALSGSSASPSPAPEFEETSKESTPPIQWTDNNEARDLELDYWDNMALPPLEDAYAEWDIGSICAASFGLELELPQFYSLQLPESSVDGHLFYDNLWEN